MHGSSEEKLLNTMVLSTVQNPLTFCKTHIFGSKVVQHDGPYFFILSKIPQHFAKSWCLAVKSSNTLVLGTTQNPSTVSKTQAFGSKIVQHDALWYCPKSRNVSLQNASWSGLNIAKMEATFLPWRSVQQLYYQTKI